jgi:hypothetical protein
MNRESLLKIIAKIEAMKELWAPDWEAQLVNRKAQLAALDRGEEVKADRPMNFTGFTKYGDPIVRR